MSPLVGYKTPLKSPIALPVPLGSPLVVYDSFDRADSATTMRRADTGQAWSVTSGTWGISSNEAYNAGDQNATLVTIDPRVSDAKVKCKISGDIAGAPDYRIPCIVVHLIDTSNFLVIYLDGGTIKLTKLDGGASSALASVGTPTVDGTPYAIEIRLSGNQVTVFKDSTQLIDVTLVGGDTKYAVASKCGFRLLKGGSPTAAARWDDFSVEV